MYPSYVCENATPHSLLRHVLLACLHRGVARLPFVSAAFQAANPRNTTTSAETPARVQRPDARSTITTNTILTASTR